MEPIRVLIADDHPLFRDGLHGLLDSVADIEVVGEASTGDEAVALATDRQPDVVLMDLRMPGLNGVQATRDIVHANPTMNVVMLTMDEGERSMFAAMRAGARGYLLKDAGQDEILRAIRAVAHGEAIFGPGVATRLLSYFATARPSTPARIFPELSVREGEILGHIASGRSNQEIAERMYLSLKTVRNHVSNILSKLQVADRAEAAMRAREVGLGRNEP